MSLLSNGAKRGVIVLLRNGLIYKPTVLSSTRQWQKLCVCNYVERKYTRKVFQPALGDNENVNIKEQEITVERKTLQEMMLEQKKEKQKMRKLNKFDKYILVKMGKYKRTQDVPDHVVYTTMKKKKEGDEEIKGFMLGTMFKYGYFFEYTAFFLSGALLFYAFYANKKHGGAVSKNNTPDESLQKEEV